MVSGVLKNRKLIIYEIIMKRKLSESPVSAKKANKKSKNSAEEDAVLNSENLLEVSDTKKKSWKNKQRVLVFASRGISSRDRHLMEDIKTLMPHGKSDSKMQRKESLFSVNEMAEMKNCNKVLLFEGRRKRDLYLWAANVARGPSAKFQVENVHTMSELKMTGNCLRHSRPLLSFDKNFGQPHWALLKELLIQIFGIPKGHPKVQPFFDHVYTFTVVDDKIWFRNYQIVEEDGSMAEIGPRFVLNPVKIFDSSFSGQCLWENPKYVTPTAHRVMLKKMKANKYIQNMESKAAYEADKPTESTYEVDETEDVFSAIIPDKNEKSAFKKKLKKKLKRKGRGLDVEI